MGGEEKEMTSICHFFVKIKLTKFDENAYNK